VQKEFDAEGLGDIHLYSLHPGAIKSTMTKKSKPASLLISAELQLIDNRRVFGRVSGSESSS
jgi:hypothetical protein